MGGWCRWHFCAYKETVAGRMVVVAVWFVFLCSKYSRNKIAANHKSIVKDKPLPEDSAERAANVFSFNSEASPSDPSSMDLRAGYSRSKLGYMFNGESTYQSAVHFGLGIPFTARLNRLDMRFLGSIVFLLQKAWIHLLQCSIYKKNYNLI